MRKFFENKLVLISICVSTILISAMLIVPNTFAYFTDRIENKGNKITSASLDFQVNHEEKNLNNGETIALNSIQENLILSIKNTGDAEINIKLSIMQNGTAIFNKEDEISQGESINVNKNLSKLNSFNMDNGSFLVVINYRYSKNNGSYGADVREYHFTYDPITIDDILSDDNLDDENIVNEENILQNEEASVV